MSSNKPVICFGQQPCGFFPRRFLVAKFLTARRLQKEIGGEIVFFYHDSDHDPRETKTTLRHKKNDLPFSFNFEFKNKTQKKFSPLYKKSIDAEWKSKTTRQLPAYLEPEWVKIFESNPAENVADFCLHMYEKMGLLDGVRVVRSSDPAVRLAACEIEDYFVDVPFEGEIVRARQTAQGLRLHKGGSEFIDLPMSDYSKIHVNPTRDSRLKWMQSVLGCTHYISGAGEQAYLNLADAPEITFVNRDLIDLSDEAFSPALLAGISSAHSSSLPVSAV